MEDWDFLHIHHPFDFRRVGQTNQHELIIESTDANEVSFIFNHVLQTLKMPESYNDQLSRDHHLATIQLRGVTTDNIAEYKENKKTDRPFERDVYWKLFILLKTRGWEPWGEMGSFIRHKEPEV